MTRRPRVLFCDIDRTLLTHGHMLLPQVAEAVQRAEANGLPVILASARSPVGVLGIQQGLNQKGPAICFNGAWTGVPATRVATAQASLAMADAREVARVANDAGFAVMWYGATIVHAIQAFAAIARRQAEVTGDALRLVRSFDEIAEAPFKLMVVTAPDMVERALGLLTMRSGALASIVASGPGLIEVVRKDASKATAAARMAASLGLEATDCAAVGDGGNDLDLLRWARLPLSVANGAPALRELARFVGGHCDTGGLADVIDWLLALPEADDFIPEGDAMPSGPL